MSSTSVTTRRKRRGPAPSGLLTSRGQVKAMVRSMISASAPDPRYVDTGAFYTSVDNAVGGTLVQASLNLVPAIGVVGAPAQSARTGLVILLEKLFLNYRVNVGFMAGTATAAKVRCVVCVRQGWDGRGPLLSGELYEPSAVGNNFGSLSPFAWETVKGKSTGRHHSEGGLTRILYDKCHTVSSLAIGAEGAEIEIPLHDLPVTFAVDSIPPVAPTSASLIDNNLLISFISDDAVPPFAQAEFFARVVFRDA